MKFSEATDVWSFGITLIEVFTDGGKPYDGLMNAAVINKVQAGGRAEQPELCPDSIYSILLKCWSANQSDRPTFAKLAVLLQAVAPEWQMSGSAFDDGSSDDDPFGGSSDLDNNYEVAVAHNPAHDSTNADLYSRKAPAPPARARSFKGGGGSSVHGYQNPMPHRSSGSGGPSNPAVAGDAEYLHAIAAVESASSEYLTVASTHFGFDDAGGGAGNSDTSDEEV